MPIDDVRRRLFHWQAESRSLAAEIPATPETMDHLDDHGEPASWAVIADRQAVTRSDTHAVMGIFGTGYLMHQYDQW